MADLSTKLLYNGLLGNAVSASFKDMAAGDTPGAAAANPGAANGLYSTPIAMLSGRNVDGSALVASSPASGAFTIELTPGTSLDLVGHTAESATSADSAVWETVLPPWYVAGNDVTVTISAGLTGTGTAGTCTVAAAAYLCTARLQGSNLIATAAQAITGTAADKAFVITGATLSPGARLMLKVTTSVQETGGVATLAAQVGSIKVS